jgi:hypothetical protein
MCGILLGCFEGELYCDVRESILQLMRHLL